MTDNLLKTALREAASREFAGMPQSDGDITYTFSPRFNRRMNRLAGAEKKLALAYDRHGLQAGCGSGYCHDTNCADCLQHSGHIWEPVAAFFKGTYENCVRFLPKRRS